MRKVTIVSGDWDQEFLDRFKEWWETAPIRGTNALTKYQDGLIWLIESGVPVSTVEQAVRDFRSVFPDGKIFVLMGTSYIGEHSGDQGSSNGDAEDRGGLPDPGDEGGRGAGGDAPEGLQQPEGPAGDQGGQPERDGGAEPDGPGAGDPIPLAGRRARRARGGAQAQGTPEDPGAAG